MKYLIGFFCVTLLVSLYLLLKVDFGEINQEVKFILLFTLIASTLLVVVFSIIKVIMNQVQGRGKEAHEPAP